MTTLNNSEIEEPKLPPLAETVFLGEIVFQIKIAKRSAELLFNEEKILDQLDYWIFIQSILTATAKVSKILWPSKGKNYIERENRANRLHQMLNVSSDNSLIDLTMRHRFEHNDERIDDWFKDKKSAVYYDNMIEGYRFEHLDFSTNYHRSYNPFTKTLSFRGESINLAEVLQELEKIILSCGNYVLT